MDGMITSKPIDVVALLRTADAQSAVTEALSQVGGVRVRASMGELSDVGTRIVNGTAPSLLLLDIDLDNPGDMTTLETLMRNHADATSIVVTSSNPTVEGMRRLMRLGIIDLVPQPIARKDVLNALKTAIGKSAPRSGPSDAEGTVLSFIGGGGGVGKTTLAVQAACGFGNGAKGDAKVCLIDLDIQFGSAALHLDVEQRSSALDLLKAPERLDGTLLRGAMARHRSGVDILASPRDLQPLDAIAPEAVVALIMAARQEYERVLIDLPQAWTGWTRSVLAASDGIALVMQLIVPSVRQARRQIDTLAEEGLDHIPLFIVANRVDKSMFTKDIPLKDAAKALERPIDHHILEDAAMIDAINFGLSLADAKGGKRASRQITEAIDAIAKTARARITAAAG